MYCNAVFHTYEDSEPMVDPPIVKYPYVAFYSIEITI